MCWKMKWKFRKMIDSMKILVYSEKFVFIMFMVEDKN